MKKLLLFLFSLPLYAQLISPSAAVRMGAVPSSCIAGGSNAILVNNAGTDEILTCDNTGHYVLPPGGSTSVLTGDTNGAAGANTTTKSNGVTFTYATTPTVSGDGTLNAGTGALAVSNLGSATVYLNNNTAIGINQAGATAGAKISAAIAALPSTGGTVDASGITGAQSWTTNIFSGVTRPITLVLGQGTTTVNSALTIPSNVTLQFAQGALLDFTAATIINASISAPGTQQIFKSTLTTVPTIGTQSQGVYVGWFGADPTQTNDSTPAFLNALASYQIGFIQAPRGAYRITSQVRMLKTQKIKGQMGIENAANGTTLYCESTTAGQCIAIADPTANNYGGGGLDDITIAGPGTSATASIGLYLGGDPNSGTITPSASYADYVTFRNLVVRNFGTGIQWGSNSWGQTFIDAHVQVNVVGLNFPGGSPALTNSGESISFHGGVIADNTTFGLIDNGGGEFSFHGTGLDYNPSGGISGTFCKCYMFGGHMEQINGPIVTLAGSSSGFPSLFGSYGVGYFLNSATADTNAFIVTTTAFNQIDITGGNIFSKHTVADFLNLTTGTLLGNPMVQPFSYGGVTAYSNIAPNEPGIFAGLTVSGSGAIASFNNLANTSTTTYLAVNRSLFGWNASTGNAMVGVSSSGKGIEFDSTGVGTGPVCQMLSGGTGPYLECGSSNQFQVSSAGAITAPSLTLGSAAVLPNLSGTTSSIGGGALLAGACTSGTVAVTGSTTAMAVQASPVTYPGDGNYWLAYVSTAGTVTVKVCTAVADTPTASSYNVRVIQ